MQDCPPGLLSRTALQDHPPRLPSKIVVQDCFIELLSRATSAPVVAVHGHHRLSLSAKLPCRNRFALLDTSLSYQALCWPAGYRLDLHGTNLPYLAWICPPRPVCSREPNCPAGHQFTPVRQCCPPRHRMALIYPLLCQFTLLDKYFLSYLSCPTPICCSGHQISLPATELPRGHLFVLFLINLFCWVEICSPRFALPGMHMLTRH